MPAERIGTANERPSQCFKTRCNGPFRKRRFEIPSPRQTLRFTFALLLVGSVSACGASQAPQSTDAEGATTPRLFQNFGTYERKVATRSPEAQKWFNQGIQLLYGFNHDEAIRSFQQAAAIDPDCAMAWWGVACANGTHINNPDMTDEQSRNGYDAAREALKRIDSASPVEQALIRAAAARFEWPAPEDRKRLDQAYADAMQKAWTDNSDDPDVGALYAESLMNLQPWDMWTLTGEPKHRTLEILSVLERVMEISQSHPGANHFYIHAIEASPWPEKGSIAADRLADLVPGSGHLVHMPSHIYIRTGRYADAAKANERAIQVDESYLANAPPPRFYRIYFIHNLHFLAYASMMEGRYETAIAATRKMQEKVPDEFLREYAKIADGLMPAVLHVQIRFGKWEDILNEPEFPEHRLVSRAVRHYARTVALAALGHTPEALKELAKFDEVAAQIDDEWFVGNNPASTVLGMARRMAAGELAYRQGRHLKAFGLLREAIAMEDELVYDEPPGWMQPVRHALGALLLEAGHASDAESVYRVDLKKHPKNAWSLLGLEQSLRAQGRGEQAGSLKPEVDAAWARADVKPTSSCYCAPGSGKPSTSDE